MDLLERDIVKWPLLRANQNRWKSNSKAYKEGLNIYGEMQSKLTIMLKKCKAS